LVDFLGTHDFCPQCKINFDTKSKQELLHKYHTCYDQIHLVRPSAVETKKGVSTSCTLTVVNIHGDKIVVSCTAQDTLANLKDKIEEKNKCETTSTKAYCK